MSDHDDLHDDDALPLGRRRFLRLGGVTGLALASATLLAGCPAQREEDDGGEGEDGSGGEEDGGQEIGGEDGGDDTDGEDGEEDDR